MAGLDEFSRAVSRIHASAGRPEMWGAALADIAGHLQATACTVTVGAGPDRNIVSTSICSEAADSYARYYQDKDFIMRACESGPVGLVHGGWDLVARNKRTESTPTGSGVSR